MDAETYTRDVDARAEAMLAALLPGAATLWDAQALMAHGRYEAAEQLVQQKLGRPVDSSGSVLASGTFDLVAAMFLVCRWPQELPASAVERMRRLMTRGVIDRCNTENHWLMYYTGNLLAAERWPDEPRWWNGHTPAQIHAEAKRWILGMIDRTVRYGQHEYDSPQYHLCYVFCTLALTEYAADAQVRGQAEKALLLYITDMALENFYGGWAGGHSREGYRKNTWQKTGDIHGLHYLYFGGEPADPSEHVTNMTGPALTSSWRPPVLLYRIATDRSTSHAVRKTRAPRTIYRHVEREAQPVRKYTWMSRSFALGSTQTGLPGAPAGPIDLVSWDLTWKGTGQTAKIVCNHPYRDARRFSAFLSELPQSIGRSVGGHKPYLQAPDRLFGGSPYERMMQHEGALIVLYDIPVDDAAPYVHAFLPRPVHWQEQDGWIFGALDGFHVALFPLAPYRWLEIHQDTQVDGWLLRMDSCRAGLVVEAVEADEAGEFTAYRDRRAAGPPDTSEWERANAVSVQTYHGHHLRLIHDGPATVDGQALDYAAYPLYDAPVISSAMNTGKVEIRHGNDRLSLDFAVDPAAGDIPMRVVG